MNMNPGRSEKRKERSESVLEMNPGNSNELLAGYMAYEFLKSGTVLGQKWDPAAAAANGSTQDGRLNLQQNQQSYSEVARLMKNDEAHVPGVVNPTQLARWIQM